MKKITSNVIAFVLTSLFLSAFISPANSATCTSISRSSFGFESTLTSAELNSQFDTVYNSNNAFDGGCINDGTIEDGALNATDFQPVLNSIAGGCLVTRSSVSAVSISACSMSVNGNMVYKASSTIVSMGCGDCSAEVGTSDYYVYVKGDSTGSTINGFLSTTAPDALGNNGTARVLAVIRNDTSSNIYEYGIDQWHVNSFIPTNYGWVDDGVIGITAAITDPTKGTSLFNDKMKWSRQGTNALVHINYAQSNTTGGVAGLGNYIFALPDGITWKDGTDYQTGTVATVDTYGSVYSNMYDAGTGQSMYGEAYVVPFSETSFTLFINTGTMTGGTDPTGFQIGSNVMRLDEATQIRGTFTVPTDAFQ
jgi:hypothetical protein